MPEGAAAVAVRRALLTATERLANAGCDSPRLDAELLLGEVLNVDRARLVTDAARALTPLQFARFSELLTRRDAREPVAYILGRRAFRNIELHVDARVLIPRPETELLVDVALALAPGLRVTDVGTGSGAVALALAQERADLVVRGTDISPEAVRVARWNAARLGLGVEFVCADLLGGGEPDAVLANLPYVSEGERAALPAEIARHEPPLALFAGDDGLAVMRRLVATLPERVGFVALEIGPDQADRVCDLVNGRGFSPRVWLDLAGRERVVVGSR